MTKYLDTQLKNPIDKKCSYLIIYFIKVYSYKYPRPSVTVDIVLLSYTQAYPQVLLIRRKNPPFQNLWALPGGFIHLDETFEESALRELYEETNIKDVQLTEVGTFGQPDRDPRGRVITIAYVGILSKDQQAAVAGSDASEVLWHSTLDLPRLAFDHNLIIEKAIKKNETLRTNLEP